MPYLYMDLKLSGSHAWQVINTMAVVGWRMIGVYNEYKTGIPFGVIELHYDGELPPPDALPVPFSDYLPKFDPEKGFTFNGPDTIFGDSKPSRKGNRRSPKGEGE